MEFINYQHKTIIIIITLTIITANIITIIITIIIIIIINTIIILIIITLQISASLNKYKIFYLKRQHVVLRAT